MPLDILAREGAAAPFCHMCFVLGLLLLWAEQAGKQPAGDGCLLDGDKASMLLRADKQFG